MQVVVDVLLMVHVALGHWWGLSDRGCCCWKLLGFALWWFWGCFDFSPAYGSSWIPSSLCREKGFALQRVSRGQRWTWRWKEL